MVKRLYLVDYKERGCDKHQAIELTGPGCLTDSEKIQMLHFYVGKNKKLSNIVEFTTDLSLEKFNRVCDMPDILTIPHRVLYVDIEEVERVREAARCMKNN